MTPKRTVQVKRERIFQRFNLSQRWEHLLLILSGTVLLLTGLPQKYRALSISQSILATPERLTLVQQIHHIAAIVLIVELLYHLGKIIYQMARRRLPADMLVTGEDFRDAGQMLMYLLFLRKDKPSFGKFNFEQKVTYWFVAIGVLIMTVTGLVLWFPIWFTHFIPGGMVPAAKLAHSTEAIVAAVFMLIWHLYHVHIERLNLSVFTGWLSEREMRAYHGKEFERITGEKP